MLHELTRGDKSDHAQLFIMSAWLVVLDPNGQNITVFNKEGYEKYFRNADTHGALHTPHRMACTNIYRTKDGLFYHIHGKYNMHRCQKISDVVDRQQEA